MIQEYVEINDGFVVAPIAKRNDERVPQFMPPRFSASITGVSPRPQVGWEYDGTSFFPATRPNPNLAPPEATNRELLLALQVDVTTILQLLTPGPPP